MKKFRIKWVELKSEMAFFIYLLVLSTFLPLFLFVKNGIKYEEKQFLVAELIGMVVFLVGFWLYRSILKKNRKIMFVFILLVFSILPQFFYKDYLTNSNSYSYNDDFLSYIQIKKKGIIEKSDSVLLKNIVSFDTIFSQGKSKDKLPTKSSLIFINNRFSVLYLIDNGNPPFPNQLIVYDVIKQNKLFTFERVGRSINTSYDAFRKNVFYNFNVVNQSEAGIGYLRFWISTITIFQLNKITPIGDVPMFLYLALFLLTFIMPFIKIHSDK